MASWGRTLAGVVDTIFLALEPCCAESCPAAHMGSLGGPVVSRNDPRSGRAFVTQSIEGRRMGGRPQATANPQSVSIARVMFATPPSKKWNCAGRSRPAPRAARRFRRPGRYREAWSGD